MAQVAANKVRNDAKTVLEKVYRFEGDYVARIGRWWDEVGELIKQLRRQVASATAGPKELAALHAEFKLHKEKVNFLDEVLKVDQKEVAAVERVVEDKRTRLDAVGAWIVELKNRREEASASTTTCYRKLF